jgi:predicted nuclease of predicted toxin-antitoxin system
MKLWLDAQLPPLLASWINAQEWGIQAVAVRDVGLRDASDPDIFRAAREAGVVVMTKDRDFIRLLEEQGPPPQVIWLRLGNCSNAALQEVLATTLLRAMDHLGEGEPWVEIRPNQTS